MRLIQLKNRNSGKINPLGKNSLCCLCDFPLPADSEKVWFDFVVRCEYLFLRNIYLYEDLKQLNIENEENYENIIRRLIEYYPLFENAIQEGDMRDEVMSFLLEDLSNCYSTLEELRKEIDHTSIPKKKFNSKKTLFSEKLIAFLYSSMLKFCKTSKVKGIPMSQKFLENIVAITEDNLCIHHSHVTGEIKGYAHFFLQ